MINKNRKYRLNGTDIEAKVLATNLREPYPVACEVEGEIKLYAANGIGATGGPYLVEKKKFKYPKKKAKMATLLDTALEILEDLGYTIEIGKDTFYIGHGGLNSMQDHGGPSSIQGRLS